MNWGKDVRGEGRRECSMLGASVSRMRIPALEERTDRNVGRTGRVVEVKVWSKPWPRLTITERCAAERGGTKPSGRIGGSRILEPFTLLEEGAQCFEFGRGKSEHWRRR
jgi:hypothetical protein